MLPPPICCNKKILALLNFRAPKIQFNYNFCLPKHLRLTEILLKTNLTTKRLKINTFYNIPFILKNVKMFDVKFNYISFFFLGFLTQKKLP